MTGLGWQGLSVLQKASSTTECLLGDGKGNGVLSAFPEIMSSSQRPGVHKRVIRLAGHLVEVGVTAVPSNCSGKTSQYDNTRSVPFRLHIGGVGPHVNVYKIHLGKIGGRKVVSGNQDGSVIVRLEWDTSVAIPRLLGPCNCHPSTCLCINLCIVILVRTAADRDKHLRSPKSRGMATDVSHSSRTITLPRG